MIWLRSSSASTPRELSYAHLLTPVHVDDPHLADAAVHLPRRGLSRLDHVHLDGGGGVLEGSQRLGDQARRGWAQRLGSHRLALGKQGQVMGQRQQRVLVELVAISIGGLEVVDQAQARPLVHPAQNFFHLAVVHDDHKAGGAL